MNRYPPEPRLSDTTTKQARRNVEASIDDRLSAVATCRRGERYSNAAQEARTVPACANCDTAAGFLRRLHSFCRRRHLHHAHQYDRCSILDLSIVISKSMRTDCTGRKRYRPVITHRTRAWSLRPHASILAGRWPVNSLAYHNSPLSSFTATMKWDRSSPALRIAATRSLRRRRCA